MKKDIREILTHNLGLYTHLSENRIKAIVNLTLGDLYTNEPKMKDLLEKGIHKDDLPDLMEEQ